MYLSKNKKYQYLFFLILSIYTFFNGGNSNLLIQTNFILINILFLYCLKDSNDKSHLKFFFLKYKKYIFVYFLFLIFILFQLTPIPIEWVKFFSIEKYNLFKNLYKEQIFVTISLDPINTYFQFLNFFSLIIFLMVVKMIFYKKNHKYRIYLYLSFLGFFSSIIAIIFYLYGNPDFLFLKNSYYNNASTGFFINRSVFSIFLLFCLISSLEYLQYHKNINHKFFFTRIYVRLFVIFTTIGIITTFSRIGNFLLLTTVVYYLLANIFSKNRSNSFRNLLIFIVIFDVFFLGFYFGADNIVQRFSLLDEEFIYLAQNTEKIVRFELIKFAFKEIKNFYLFGYGLGSFEILFQLKYQNLSLYFANHAHSDVIEFFGELGLVGFSLLILSLFNRLFIKNNFNDVNLLLILILLVIILIDFSLHIPIIQILFIIFFTLNKTSYGSS